MEQENNNLENNPLKFSPKNIVILVLLAVGLYLLAPKLVGVEQAILLLDKVNKNFLVLALLAEISSYVGAATVLGIIFSRMGHKLSFFTRFRLGSVAAFTMHFLPIGAAGGAAFEYSFLRKQAVDSGSIIVMWILRWIFSYTGFLILFLVSLILLPISPKLPFSPKFISIIFIMLIAGFALYVIYLYKNKEKFWVVWTKIFNGLNSLIKKFKKDPISLVKQKEIFEDIYTGIELFSKKKRSSVFAVLAGMLYWFGDMICLYFVFWAFGYSINFGVLIFGYCISTLLGILSFVPGGIGVTEGSMALIFTGMGVPSVLALTAVLVFRLFSFWIWIPVGFLSYLSLQKTKSGIIKT
jgi:uncharacterized protein (TIRG00374 family)